MASKTARVYDAIVIGAGVIGSAIALELSRRGHRTLSIDKLPSAGYGSTSASSAIIRFSYSTRSGVAMAYEGLHYWRDWPHHIGDIGDQVLAEYVQLPMLMLKTEGSHDERVVPHFEALGIPYEDLDFDEATRRFPLIDFATFGPPAPLDDLSASFWTQKSGIHDGAIVMPEAGYISDPQLAALNLATAAIAAGGEFRYRTEVGSIEHTDGRVVGVTTVDGESIESRVVVNAAGPHSSKINALAGFVASSAMTTRALRREVYLVAAPPGVDFDSDGFSIGDADTGTYIRGERGNNLLVGNAEPECDELVWVDDPDDYDETVSEDGFKLHVLRAARRLPDLGVPLRKSGLVSLYDVTPDWTPVYDRSDLDGFYLACGTSGNQFKNAPVVGHLMAELIEAVSGGLDHDAEPLVVDGPRTGLAIDLSTFSRNRTISDGTISNVFG